MKSKLLSAVAMPVALTLGAASAFAQTAVPSPSEAPPERMQETTPAPTPAPSPSVTVPAPSSERATGAFSASQTADEWRSSKLIGLTVYNAANEKIGDINDLILGPDGKIANAVIGVGGFLGMGEKLVAVSFSDLQLNRDADGTMRVTLNSTKDALENAPEFKYYAPAATKAN